MSLKLSFDHPAWQTKSTIQQLCQPFLREMNVSYFQFLRCYADGSVGLLTNNTCLIEFFPQVDNVPVVYSSMEEEQQNQLSYWFLWDEVLPEFPVEIARNHFNIRCGITWVRRCKDYYDMIAFALDHEQENPGTYYLNKLPAFENFIHQFDKGNKDLIQLMAKNPIALPPEYQDVNHQRICLLNEKISIQGLNGSTYLTHQELACIRLLSRGDSYKMIANQLELSPRTVETYLNRVKWRTGFQTQKELARLL